MGLLFKVYLSPEKGHIFACSNCRTHFTTNDLIISKQFQGQHGRAFLFNKVVNVAEGEPQTRSMTTGLHTVRDIFCQHCNIVVGWKYEKAYEETQRYKEGKYILEKALLSVVND
ncbi:yippee-like protein [Paraphysoderma sedebokerense]|nr:yippee-like protein [Paraphysoderma sedebokerense]